MTLVELKKCYEELAAERDWPGRHPEFISAIECAMADLSELPRIEYTPVVHAKWIHRPDERICPICGYRYSYFGGKDHNFCSECGADMRGENNG